MSRSKKMKAISSEVVKISFGTTMVRPLSVSDDCPPPSPPSLLVPTEEYTYFLTKPPDFNNETITLNFRNDRQFIVEDTGVDGGLEGIAISNVYFLPKGTKVEDLIYKVVGDSQECRYKYNGPFLPSASGDLASPVALNMGTIFPVGPKGDREGMLKFNIENKGNYTGLNGDVRLYISVYLEYRDVEYAFYVN